MRNASFQMYDDDVTAPVRLYGKSFYHPAKFPTRNIATPIVLLYGDRDSLVDINVMLAELPEHTIATPIPNYEHIDLLWGDEVDKVVIPRILDALETYRRREKIGNGDAL